MFSFNSSWQFVASLWTQGHVIMLTTCCHSRAVLAVPSIPSFAFLEVILVVQEFSSVHAIELFMYRHPCPKA